MEKQELIRLALAYGMDKNLKEKYDVRSLNKISERDLAFEVENFEHDAMLRYQLSKYGIVY